MRWIFVIVAGLTATIVGARAQGSGDASKGQTLFQQQCHVCHQVGPGAKSGIGPELNDIFGQNAAAVSGFSFSPAMRQAASKGTMWDETNLDKFLENPQGLVPGTTMAYLGLKNPSQRADMIAYLQTLKSK
jgi:cytochrome c2